jgi:hypothetical protein
VRAIHKLLLDLLPGSSEPGLAADAGLRGGEALGLTVPRVEFLARRLVVVEQMQNKVLSPLKTRASRRLIPVDDIVLNPVTAHMQRWTRCSPRLMCAQCAPGNDHEHAAARQRTGGGRAGL